MTKTADPLPALVRALHSQSPTDRARAARDLGRLGWLAREALPALVTALQDDDAKVRETGAHAIGLMGPEALPALIEMLAHDDKYVRRQAVWALSKLGPLARPTLGDLCRALKDADPRTGSGAAQALGGSRWSVVGLMLGESAWYAGAGRIGGIGLALEASRMMKGLLFEVPATDAPTYVTLALGVGLLVTLASYGPARRAASVNPADALRADR